MAERAYTLSEIDRLRDAAREWYGLNSNFASSELEGRVRTLMVAGIDPEKLETAVAERRRDQRNR